jgi:NAD(P)-dependent dehydrogenase (short-subunit alcohol dehydrogenase family)
MADHGSHAVVITGASTGIGAACALSLDRLGFRVFAGVRRTEDGEALAKEASARLTPIRLDVTEATSIAAAADLVRAAVAEGGLAGLINNAGIAVGAPLEAVPIADLRRQFETNVVGAVAVTQALLPLLRQGRGRLINIGSIAGRATMPLMGPYSASKYALEALTDAWRLELLPWGIRVSIIEPGAIATPIWRKSSQAARELEAASPPEVLGLYAPAVAAVKKAVEDATRRAIPPDAVVRAVVHALTSPRPKTRYLVGWDAKIRAWMVKLLPDRVADHLLVALLRLPH